jgi:hypothetical protein
MRIITTGIIPGLLAAAVLPLGASEDATFTIRLYGQTLPQELDSLHKESKTAWGQIKSQVYDEDALQTDNAFRAGIDLVSSVPLDSAGILQFISAFGGSYGEQEYDLTDPVNQVYWDLQYNLSLINGNLPALFYSDAMRSDQMINDIKTYMANLKLGLGLHPLPFLHLEALGFGGAGTIDNEVTFTSTRYPLATTAAPPPAPFAVGGLLLPYTTEQQKSDSHGYTYEVGVQAGLYLDLGPLQLGAHGGHLWGRQVMEAAYVTPGLSLSDYIQEAFIDGDTINASIKGFFAGVSVGVIF